MSKIIIRNSRRGLSLLLVSLSVVLALSALSAGIRTKSTTNKTVQPAPKASPGSGMLNPTGGMVTWTGSAAGGVSIDESTCVDGVNCDTFTLTLNGNPGDWSGKKAHIKISWTNANDDFDLFVHKTNNSGALVGSSAQGGAGPEEIDIDPSNPAVGTGVFTVHVVYFAVIPLDTFNGEATVTSGGPTPTPTPTPGITPTPAPVAGAPRFQNYTAPPGVGDDAGEPSIGINWNTEQSFSNNNIVTGLANPPIPNGGTSNYYGGFLSYMLKITFDDCSSPANAIWEQKPVTLPATTRAFGDPILFTDRGWPAYPGMSASLGTGRTFVSQLEGLTPAGSTMEFTDNNGDTFLPSEGGAPSGVDHQTIGGGPFHAPIPPGLVYPNAVYYASQSIADATSELSIDGGVTFPLQTPMFTAADCFGLHGHLKVAPDGTAFVPDKGCASLGVPLLNGGEASVVVSEDNNVTWQVRPIPGATTSGNDDPSVGVATDSNTIFLGYQAANGHARIAVSHDKGQTWIHDTDVGAQVGVQNCAFPAVVAGDGEQNGPNTSRAAFAFFGTTTGGSDADQPTFPGVWYLYIATTFDGGNTWTTVNATPGDPIQRGGICGAGACRNLLDFFDMGIDKQGRIVVGSEDGCVGGCVNGGPNSFTAKAFISRQSGGKRMYAQFDPMEPVVPGAPAVTAVVNGGSVNLSWEPPDSGGSTITKYKVYRGMSGVFALVAMVDEPQYTDAGFTAGNKYRVTAVNAQGEGPYCHDVTPDAGGGPTACDLPGVPVISDLNPDGSDNDMAPNLPIDGSVNIRQLFVAEPFVGGGVNKLVFTLQDAPSTTGAAPPNSQWYIIWNRHNPTADFDRFYVAMKTDVSGATTFEYGNFGVALDPMNPNPNANTPVRIGDADNGTYDPATGLITITLDKSKAEMADGGYGAGSDLTGLNVRTYFNRPDPGQRSQNNASDITADSSYTLVGNASCASVAQLINVVSRKTHGSAGDFDIKLAPLVPPTSTAVECRAEGAAYHVVFLFAQPVTFTGASSTSGAVTTNPAPGSSPTSEVTVNLTGVSATPQTVTVSLLGASAGAAPADFTARMSVVVGDTDGNGSVNSTDVSQTKMESGSVTDEDNFRRDVSTNGLINSTDVSIVKARSGTGLP